jgi:predicted transcriptional regulator
MQKLRKKSHHSQGATRAVDPSPSLPHAEWTFLTNHSHVLLCLFRRPDQRLWEVASAVGITERMVQRIVAELVAGGYLKIQKSGRRNHYTVAENLALRHPLEKQHSIGELLTLLGPPEG